MNDVAKYCHEAQKLINEVKREADETEITCLGSMGQQRVEIWRTEVIPLMEDMLHQMKVVYDNIPVIGITISNRRLEEMYEALNKIRNEICS